MAGRYNAGSVDAKITLDSKEFEETINKLKGQTKEIQNQMKTSSEASSSYINNLKKSVDKLKQGQQQLYGSTTQASKGLKEEAESIKNLAKASKTNTKNINDNIKKNNELVKSNEKVTKSMKKMEKQAKFGLPNLEASFTKSLAKMLYLAKANGDRGQTEIKPIYDVLKKKYKSQVRNKKEFDDLFYTALPIVGSKMLPTRDSNKFQSIITRFGEKKNFGYFSTDNLNTIEQIKKGIEGTAIATDKVTESTEKATTATKELETAMLDLSGKTKYSFNEIVQNASQLPSKMRTAVQAISRILSKYHKSLYPDTIRKGAWWEVDQDVKAWAKLLPMFDEKEFLQNYIHRPSHERSVSYINKDWFEDALKHGGKHPSINFEEGKFKGTYLPELDPFKGLKKGYNDGVKFYKNILKQLQEVEIVSRKTGEAVKQLGAEESETNAQTNKWAEGTEAYKAQLIGLSSLIKGYNGLGKRYKQTNEEIINSLTQMAEANEKVAGSAQKAYNALDVLRKEGYNFGFKGLDAKDARYIGATLRALNEMQIKPRNPAIRLFSSEDIAFAHFLFDESHGYRSKGIVPSKSFFRTDHMWGDAGAWYHRLGDDSNVDTREGKQIAKQTAQAAMNKIFDFLEVELIKAAGRKGTRFYDPILGKNIGITGLDISNLPKDWQEIEKAMNGAVNTAKLLEIEEEAIVREERLIQRMAYNIIDRLPEAEKEVLDIARAVTDVEQKLTRINKARKAISSGNFLLGGKTNYNAIAKDLEKAINKSMLGDLNRKPTWNKSLRIRMNSEPYRVDTKLPNQWYDNAQWNDGALYLKLSDILAKLHEKYGIVINDAEHFNKIIEKTNLNGLFFGKSYYPATSELVDSLGSLFMESWAESNQLAVKAFADLMNGIMPLIDVSEKASESIKKMGTDTVTTAATVNELEGELKQLETNEQTTSKSTDNLSKSLQKAVTQANNLKGEVTKSLRSYANDFEDMYFEQGSLAIRKLYEANVLKYYGELDPSQWLKEVYKWGKQVENLDLSKFIGAYSDLTNFRFLGSWKDTESILNSFREVDEVINQIVVDLEVINRVRIGDNWTVTLKSTGQAVKETVATLDNFTVGVEKAKKAGRELETETKKVGETAKGTANEIKQLTNEINKGFGENLPVKSVERLPIALKKATEGEKEFERQMENGGKTAQRTSRYYNNIFKQLNELDKKFSVTRPIDSRNLKEWNVWGDGFARSGKTIANTTQSLKTFDNTVLTTANDIKIKLVASMKSFYEMATQMEIKIPDEVFDSWKQAIGEVERFEKRYETLQQRMYDLSRGRGYWQNKGKQSTGYGRTLADQVLSSYGLLGSTVIGGQVVDFDKVRSDIEASIFGKNGRVNTVGYSDYVARITEIKESLTGATTSSNTFKESLVGLATAIKSNNDSLSGFVGKSEQAVKALTSMAEANERFTPTKIEELSQVLQHFSSISEKNRESLAGLSEQATILQDKFRVLGEELVQGTISEETYDKETKKLTADLEKLGATATTEIRKLNMAEPTKFDKVNSGINKSKNSLNEFGKAMNNQEKYVNNLYRGLQKARSVIISMKTILRMMGGMAIWNFAFELVESAKETYIAKNEMESLLEQNAKVNTSGINAYNKALDETARKFQKINKYSLGETGASIGLEFNLNAQEMAKSLDVIAMVQSEYIRAGRTTEEASLAVKDILQGEFMRLSRETGVGKDDLKEKYGWNGDTSDVLNLMEALEKAGKERHWDVFAGKATSLNDVLTITQSRFSELGAEIASHSEPLIIGAFNALLGTVDSLKQGFEGLGSFGKTTVTVTGITGAILGLSSAYMVLAKDMGVLDIATLGWSKSLASTVLQLDKAEVAVHGFWKTLLANISGTEASTVANTGFVKSLTGRLLGLEQNIVAENGLGKALDNHIIKMTEGKKVAKMYAEGLGSIKVNLKEVSTITKEGVITKDKDAMATLKLLKRTSELSDKELTFAQRLAGLTTNMKYNELAQLSNSKAILKTATSWKVLRTAILGVTSIALIGWLASVVAWTDKVKKNVEGFYNVVDNGETLIKDAQSAIESNSKALDDVNKRIEERKANNKNYSDLLREQNGLLEDQKTAQANLYNIQKATELAKVKSERLQEFRSRIDTHHTTQLAEAYMKLGNTTADAQLKANDYYSQVRVGSYYAEKALEKYDETLNNGVSHSLAHALALQKQGVDQDKLNQYMMDYNLITEEVAENWRKFNEGDVWAGAYALVGQLKQAWTDFMITPEADTLFGAIGRFVTWITPSVKTLIGYLQELGKWAINGLSWLTQSDLGNFALTIGGIVTGVGILALKFKSVRGVLKTLGKTLKDRITDWRNLKKEAEEASEKMGGSTSTGGINGEKGKTGKTGGWWNKEQIQSDVQKYTRAAVAIAAGMVLIAEAIAFMMLPMGALALTGEAFEHLEPSIRKGIRGLTLIAPVMAAFLPPVVALMTIMQYYGDVINAGTMKTAFKASAQVIAVGMLLVSEAIVMMVAPMLAISAVGWIKGLLGDSVEKGKEAIEATTDALGALVPVIPLFIVAIGLGIVALSGVGALASAAIIAAGMGLVAVGVLTLAEPMLAISALGYIGGDLQGVKQGAEAVKATAEAMGYVEEAMRLMAMVEWELISTYIGDIIRKFTHIDLTSLTEEGGFFDELKSFITEFNKLEIVSPLQEKVDALNEVAEGMGVVGTALEAVKTAMENLPSDFKNGGSDSLVSGYDPQTGQKTQTSDTTGYFDQLKEPLKELGTFIDWFNNELDFPSDGVDTGKLDTITQSADMVTQINDAVNKVKEAMGNIAWGNINTNVAQATGGGIPAFGGLGALVSLGADAYGAITGSNGAGDYQSSIGGQLHEMELVIKDLAKFSSNISTASNGGGAFGEGANVDALTQMVTTISDAITKLNDTLAQAVPQIKQNATNIGSGIKEGIKTGMGSLAGLIVTPLVAELQSAKANAGTYGKGTGWSFTNGFKIELKVKSATETEIGSTLTYLDGKKQDFYNKGYDLGDSLSRGYKDGQDMHSPGIIARSTKEELGRLDSYFDEAIISLPQKAFELGDTLSSNFNPTLAMGGLSVNDLSTFQDGLDTVQSMSSATSLQTTTDFTNMSTSVSSNMAQIGTTVNGAFTTIKQNTTSSYAQLTNTTRNSLNNMQNQTTKNINAIRTSWKGMQTALIQSAENIRSQTSQKISNLESNMASFWRKVQNPANLLGAAGNPFAAQHTIRRRSNPSRLSNIGFAGGGKSMGISSKFKPVSNNKDPSMFERLFRIIGGNVPLYAGGWTYNWIDDIRKTLLQWHTHFGEIYDKHLTVGKFENDDFPVRGIAEIAKNYIYDAISRTHYVGYFNSRYGDDPLAAWNAGGFNCWDGANVVIALANAFGFGGGYKVHGSWDGIPHVWARIPGLGDIDATAIQGGYGFTASKVRGAGSINPSNSNGDFGTTNNYNGDINIHIHTDGKDVEIDDKKIDDETGRKIIDLLGINPSTGR